MIDRGETSSDLGRELMRQRMKSYLAPVAAVLFRAPQRVYFLWHPQDLAVASRQFRYAILTQCRAIPRSCRELPFFAGIYSLW